MLAIILLIVMGLASVIGSEMLSVVALSNAPTSFNLTNDFFIALVLPSVAVVVALNALILWKVFSHRTGLRIAIYTATYSLAYAGMLAELNNPPGDIATYLAIVLITAPVILGTFYALFWRVRT